MKGRKPKPTALKLVTGNPGKRKPPAHEPKPRRAIPSPPAHLSQRAAVAWGALGAQLDRVGVLTVLDALALEQLCENYGEVLEHRADIAANGRVRICTSREGDTVERARPVQAQLSDAERRFRAMLVEFGLTPSARTRVHGDTDDSDQTTNAAQSYFG